MCLQNTVPRFFLTFASATLGGEVVCLCIPGLKCSQLIHLYFEYDYIICLLTKVNVSPRTLREYQFFHSYSFCSPCSRTNWNNMTPLELLCICSYYSEVNFTHCTILYVSLLKKIDTFKRHLDKWMLKVPDQPKCKGYAKFLIARSKTLCDQVMVRWWTCKRLASWHG